MKAIQIEAPGKDYRLLMGVQDRPKPGPGEVLLQVAIYAGVPAGIDATRTAKEALAEVDAKP